MFGHEHPEDILDVDSAADRMALVPLANEQVEVVADYGERGLILEVSLRYHGMVALMARLVRASTVRRLQLDGMALEIYHMVGPKTTVAMMVDAVAHRHRLTFFEARGVVFWFLKLLAERGIIVVGQPETAEKTDS